MTKPIKMTLRASDSGAFFSSAELRYAGYKPGDEVELVPAGRVEALEEMLERVTNWLAMANTVHPRPSSYTTEHDLVTEARALLAKGGAE